MNIINIIKTIKKLKAGVSALIEDRQDLITKSKFIYMREATLTDSDQEKTIIPNQFY